MASALLAAAKILTGTPGQLDWAAQIKPLANADFDRVAAAFRAAAERQSGEDRVETMEIINILEEKRLEVMANPSAGYFIREWRELGGQVRRLIAGDPRYKAIQENRAAKRKTENE